MSAEQKHARMAKLMRLRHKYTMRAENAQTESSADYYIALLIDVSHAISNLSKVMS